MFKKNLAVLSALFSAFFIFNSGAAAQESVPATVSEITEARLPAGAERVLPASVPAQISDGLRKFVEAGNGKFRQGDSEVLAWSGTGYRKANAENLMSQLQANLQAKGWKYEVGGREGEVTVFTVFKDKPVRRGVLGFYVPTDDALVVAWTEVFSAEGQTNAAPNDSAPDRTENAPARNTGGSRAVVGTWTNGSISMIGERNTVTGATTPSNGSTFKYVFTADGRFEFIGLINSTMYGCTTSLFNDKRGRYEITGSQITFIPNKNFWRNTYSCSPASNKERDYVLEKEVYSFYTKQNEYNQTLICLTNDKGERCFRREEK